MSLVLETDPSEREVISQTRRTAIDYRLVAETVLKAQGSGTDRTGALRTASKRDHPVQPATVYDWVKGATIDDGSSRMELGTRGPIAGQGRVKVWDRDSWPAWAERSAADRCLIAR